MVGDHLLALGDGDAAINLTLTPERAVFWPAEQTLFAADLHIGKAAVFRARGVPVPRGTTSATLARLTQVIARTGTRRLVVLGDFLHARESHAVGTLAALRTWREAHAGLDVVLVQGNHDRHAGALEQSLGFDVLHEPYVRPGLAGAHEPRDAKGLPPGHGLLLLGHLHPVVTLQGRMDRLRLPCYWLAGQQLTLPAFGEFTGGYEVPRGEGRPFAIAERVVDLAAHRPRD